jgi:SAM-dependent methyltransferase
VTEVSAHDLQHEKDYFNASWASVDTHVRIAGVLQVPGLPNLRGRRVLICSCGSGRGPVEAANAGALAHAVDVSVAAVRNARSAAAFNAVAAYASVQDLHHLAYPDGYFDVVYGSAVLHHLDLETACREFARVLCQGGVAFFSQEPTFFNPLLRWSYRIAFGMDRQRRRRRFLFLKRIGTDNEKPFDEADIKTIRSHFSHVQLEPAGFMFFQKLSHVLGGCALGTATALDQLLVRLLPPLQRWSYEYNMLLRQVAAVTGHQEREGRPAADGPSRRACRDR